MAAPALFFGLIIAITAGIYVNIFAVRKFKLWWKQLLVILAGLVATVVVLVILGQLFTLQPKSGSFGVGEAIGVGIGMAVLFIITIILGSAAYIVSSALTSLVRWVKKKRRKA